MLRNLLAALLVTTFGCTSSENTLPSRPEVSTDVDQRHAMLIKSKRSAGALYFASVGEVDIDLENLLSQVTLKVGEELQVTFSKTAVLREGEYPPLAGTDILLYFVKEKDVQSANLVSAFDNHVLGSCCIGYEELQEGQKVLYKQEQYEGMKKLTNHPYNLLTSAANLGFVIIDHPSCSKEITDRIMMHEIGHFLGAAHVMHQIYSGFFFRFTKVSLSPQFYMSYLDCSDPTFTQTPPHFDSKNVESVDSFLEKTASSPSKEEIIRLRGQYLNERVIVNP